MADAAKKRATYEDLLAVPEEKIAEIINGELIVQPRPASPHALAYSALGSELFGPFHIGRNGPGGWVILDEPELHLQEDILVPDIAGWRRERMPVIPEAPFFTLAPDWLCEIFSPSTKVRDRADKLPIYAGEGVVNVWFVDPLDRTLESFRLDGETYRLLGTWRDDAQLRLEPFDAIELELALLWKR